MLSSPLVLWSQGAVNKGKSRSNDLLNKSPTIERKNDQFVADKTQEASIEQVAAVQQSAKKYTIIEVERPLSMPLINWCDKMYLWPYRDGLDKNQGHFVIESEHNVTDACRVLESSLFQVSSIRKDVELISIYVLSLPKHKFSEAAGTWLVPSNAYAIMAPKNVALLVPIENTQESLNLLLRIGAHISFEPDYYANASKAKLKIS